MVATLIFILPLLGERRASYRSRFDPIYSSLSAIAMPHKVNAKGTKSTSRIKADATDATAAVRIRVDSLSVLRVPGGSWRTEDDEPVAAWILAPICLPTNS